MPHPPDTNCPDGRVADLPRPAVNLAARIAQLAGERRDGVVEARILIIGSRWFLRVEGDKVEELGRWRG